MNRLVTMTNTTLGKSVGYTYFSGNLKSSMTDGQGGTTQYTYDSLKRLTSMTNNHGETTNYSYDKISRLIGNGHANAINTTFTYDAANRLTLLANKTVSDVTLSSYAYAYDKADNRTSMTNSEGTHSYAYDKIYQLLQADHPVGSNEAYTYDASTRRLTSADHADWSYDTAHQLLNYDGQTFTYDANGNMITRTDTASSETTTYQYDHENRLTRIEYPDGTYSAYDYDPFGNRVKADLNGTTTWFLYDLLKGLPDVIAEYDQSNNVIVTYTHGPGTDEIIAMRRDGNSYYYLRDGLGSITGVTDNVKTLVNTYTYDTFGNIIDSAETITNSYTYTARRLDAESGLMYFRARYYLPNTGRFISEDPIKLTGESYFYKYCDNNPVNRIDPYGLKPWIKEAGLDFDIHAFVGGGFEVNYVWDSRGNKGVKICLKVGTGESLGVKLFEESKGTLTKGADLKLQESGSVWGALWKGKSRGVSGSLSLANLWDGIRDEKGNQGLGYIIWPILSGKWCPKWTDKTTEVKWEKKSVYGGGLGASSNVGGCFEYYF